MNKNPKKPKKTVKRKLATVVANKFRKPENKKFAVKAVKPKGKKVLKRKVVTAAVNKLRKPAKKKFEIKNAKSSKVKYK